MIATNLEQSNKLLELGIDRKTSDMYYWCGDDLSIGGYRAQDEELDIPTWSLSALLGIMPHLIIVNNIVYWNQMVKGLNKDGYTYSFVYKHNKSDECVLRTDYYNNPIDAAVEMVVLLKSLEKTNTFEISNIK